MKKSFLFLLITSISILITSCKVQQNTLSIQSVIRQAENIPDNFEPPSNLILDNVSCKNPMIDSRNGTKIILLSAQNGLGKYEVPNGSYGVKKGEALLLDCSNGKVKGIVLHK